MHLDPIENPIDILHPSGNLVTAYLMDSPSVLSLPYHLPGVESVNALLGMIPPQLMELFIQKGQRIARGETDWTGAAIDFFETAVMNKERWQTTPPGYPSGWWMWALAEGHKEGRKARYLCWPSMVLDWTTVPLVIVSLRILRGDVSMHGVLSPEACFELGSFFEEAARYLREENRGKSLLNERFEWLE